VRRTGGEQTPWAKAVRRGLEQDADPLRQQHRAEMNERFQARGDAVTQLLTQTRAQHERAQSLEEPKREQRLARIAAGERRALEATDNRYALESFVSWSVRRRREIEREAPFLEKQAQHREQHQAQRAAHDVVKAEKEPRKQAAKPVRVVEIRRAPAIEPTVEPEPKKKGRGDAPIGAPSSTPPIVATEPACLASARLRPAADSPRPQKPASQDDAIYIAGDDGDGHALFRPERSAPAGGTESRPPAPTRRTPRS
jgi:hypothetical protein